MQWNLVRIAACGDSMSDFNPRNVVELIAASIVSSEPDMSKGAQVDWSLVATQLALGYIAVSLMHGVDVEAIAQIIKEATERMDAKDGAADAFVAGASIEAGLMIRAKRVAAEAERKEPN